MAWAMQLVLRDDRPARPTHLAVCSAAARAVVTLLEDPRCDPDGPWAERVRYWESGPIRKVVRRGRGARFAATDELEHVEVEADGAVVRAFVPGPVDAIPAQLSRLQVGGTQMPELGEPHPPVPGGLTVALTPRHALSTGKAAAQCAHAAHLAREALQPAELGGVLQGWRATGFAVRVLCPAPPQWERLGGTAAVVVRDGGYTEVPPGTVTALAWW